MLRAGIVRLACICQIVLVGYSLLAVVRRTRTRARQQIDHSIVKRAVAAELALSLSIALNLLSEESQRVPTSYLLIIYCGARKRHNVRSGATSDAGSRGV